MTPQERQLRILEFIERYQRDRRDAPTIREVVMGSGVSSYSDIEGDIEALLLRRQVAWVAEAVSGSEPFSSRQVRSTRDPTSLAGSGGAAPTARPSQPAAGGPGGSPPSGVRPLPARPAASAPAHRSPGAPAGRGAAPWAGRQNRPPASSAGRGGLPPAGSPPATPPGWGQAPGGGAPPAAGQTAMPPPPPGPRAQPAGGGRGTVPDPWGPGAQIGRASGPRSATPGRPQAAGPGPSMRGGLGPWLRPWHLALAGMLTAAYLLYRFGKMGGSLPSEPAVDLLGKARSLWGFGLVLVWCCLGLALALGLERRTWQARDVLSALLWGGLGGLAFQAGSILGQDLLPQDMRGLQRLAEAALETLPMLLALRFAPFAGAALLAQGAALSLALSLDSSRSFSMLVLLLLPLQVLPAELALFLPDQRVPWRLPLVGATLGALQSLVGQAFFPVASYPGALTGALAGAAMGALLESLAARVEAFLAARRAGRIGRSGPLP